jgi:hypothetical protein
MNRTYLRPPTIPARPAEAVIEGLDTARTNAASPADNPVIKPWPLQQAAEGGFILDDFHVDEQAAQVSGPNGTVRPITPTTT